MSELGAEGVWLGRAVLPGDTVSAWSRAADVAYASPRTRAEHGFVPTASSMRLAALPLLEIVAVVHAAVGAQIAAALGGPAAANLDQAWLRRQFPLRQAPALHHPHGWHQDGALGHDFLGGPAAEGLVPMVTVWVPLTACGVQAPGLEWIAGRQPTLRPLSGLTPAAMQADFAPPVRPALALGDALLFHGDVLHRTAVAPQMARPRTSVELRWCAAGALPPRLSSDRWHAPHR